MEEEKPKFLLEAVCDFEIRYDGVDHKFKAGDVINSPDGHAGNNEPLINPLGQFIMGKCPSKVKVTEGVLVEPPKRTAEDEEKEVLSGLIEEKEKSKEALKKNLLEIKGIGEATVDMILEEYDSKIELVEAVVANEFDVEGLKSREKNKIIEALLKER